MNLEGFKTWLTLNCDETNTINTYYRQIDNMFKVISEPLTQENITGYFLLLRERKISNNSFNIVLNSVKKYLLFTKQTFELPKQRGIDMPINKFITIEELQNDILPYLQNICGENYNMAEITIKLLFFTGIRRKELLNLKRTNFDFNKNTIELLNTKGNVDRKVPFDNILKKQIQHYFSIYPETHNAFNITLEQIDYIFERINAQLPLKDRVNARIFRHSAGTHFIRQGLSEYDVMVIMGHKDLKTTMRYAKPNFDGAQEKYMKLIKGF